MGKVKRYLIAVAVMLVVSVLALMILGVLTYWFKWQADKAMVGIVATYVLAGIAGGVVLKILSQMQFIEVFILATLYMLALFTASILFLKTTPVISSQLLMIYGLVVCSVFVGKLIVK